MNEQHANAIGKKASSMITGIGVAILAVIGVVLFFIIRGTPATDIIFVEDSMEIVAGGALKIGYVILPNSTTNKEVTWESSNTSVAEVSSTGLVTAVGEGTAIITVTTSNGKIDECLVTVKPTAFDYMKKLSNLANGYTVGSYRTSSGATIDIGLYYNHADSALYIMDIYNGKDSATLVIPSSLTGNYDGVMERSYSDKTVRTLYLIDASILTADTDITSYYCDSKRAWDITDNDAVYTANVRAMLSTVYREVLEPNGYTYADLGFNSYS